MKPHLKYGALALGALITLSLVVCAGLVVPSLAAGTSYYVDCSAATNGDGSLSSPWNNLASVNGTTFAPGDSILFKRGTTCSGQLWPKGSGSDGSPIVIDAYGTGDKPHVAGGGVSDAVYLYNQEYWEIRNLEVSNTGAIAENRRGVYVKLEDFGTGTHYYLIDLTVHDVNGDNTKDRGGSSGIHFDVYGSAVQTKFSDVVIEGNTVYTVDRSGINMSSAWWCRASANCVSGQAWYGWDPFIIRSNLVYDIGGDGIVNQYACGSTVEYNVVHHANARSGTHNAGIWAWNADYVTFQFNEAFEVQGTLDGQGYDIDYGQIGTTHQYGYSHDNNGGFMLVCGPTAGGTVDGTIRYNISQNDRTRVFHVSGPIQNIQIYNNTIYVGAGLDTTIVLEGRWGGYPQSVYFWNNIFYNLGSGDYVWGSKHPDVFFDYNVFYGNHPPGEPDDPHKITDDPLLVNPGSGGNGLASVGGYKLQLGSPAIGAGRIVADNGGRDFWGNDVPSDAAPDIGAHQFSSEGTPTPGPSPTPQDTATPYPTIPPSPTPGAGSNMALGRPVEVSSEEASWPGSGAVDGNLESEWHTASGSSAPSEYIEVDLGEVWPVSEVIIRWAGRYATTYTIQLSENGTDWTTVYSTTSGSGGTEDITFDTTSGRYVMMDSTAWQRDRFRCQIKEFEIYQ
jgi:hypothetical protein